MKIITWYSLGYEKKNMIQLREWKKQIYTVKGMKRTIK